MVHSSCTSVSHWLSGGHLITGLRGGQVREGLQDPLVTCWCLCVATGQTRTCAAQALSCIPSPRSISSLPRFPRSARPLFPTGGLFSATLTSIRKRGGVRFRGYKESPLAHLSHVRGPNRLSEICSEMRPLLLRAGLSFVHLFPAPCLGTVKVSGHTHTKKKTTHRLSPEMRVP